jgi:hypothetical protein
MLETRATRKSGLPTDLTTAFLGALPRPLRGKRECRRGESNTDRPRLSHYQPVRPKRLRQGVSPDPGDCPYRPGTPRSPRGSCGSWPMPPPSSQPAAGPVPASPMTRKTRSDQGPTPRSGAWRPSVHHQGLLDSTRSASRARAVSGCGRFGDTSRRPGCGYTASPWWVTERSKGSTS